MGFKFLFRSDPTVKLSVFGLDQIPNPRIVTSSLEELDGVREAKLDTKKNIMKVVWEKNSRMTKEDLISALFSFGLAAEELG
jgi:hypothetical protein